MLRRLTTIRLNAKILILTLITGLLPLMAISAFMFNEVELMLQQEAENRLYVAAKSKQKHVEQYFNTIEHQVENLAHNQMVIQAARDMSTSFYTVGAENQLKPADLKQMRIAVQQYYTTQFAERYQADNPDKEIDVVALVNRLSPDSLVQQYYYIANNTNPLGEKDALIRSTDRSAYAQQHAQVHPILRRYLQSFGYYDIFLLHPTNGDVMYSVYKELDFGTSLLTGGFANSNLAEAYKRALSLPQGESVLVDFTNYTPSYEAPASFIAAPVYDGSTLVGVLCFQMPLDNINQILNDSERIGETGEIVLVGEDGLMRSNSRLKTDTHTVMASFRHPDTGKFDHPELMASFNSQFDQSKSIRLVDYRQQEVLLNRELIDLDTVKMLLIAKIDTSEADALARGLSQILFVAFGLSVLFIMLASLTVSRNLSRPIVEVAQRMRHLASGMLGEPQFEDAGQDEVGTLKSAYNDLLTTLREMVQDTQGYSDSLTGMATTLLATAQQQQTGTAEQASAAEETKNLLTMLLESSKEVAQASQLVFDNADITQKNAGLIATHIDELSHHVDGIGEILALIKDIAAKSDLLALNAALEGTKAGEAGRGFSLVAMQMQKLAEQVMTSAKNIDALTSDITKSTNASVMATEEATKLATETTKSAHQITFAVQQQQEGTQEASIALDEIAQVASEAAIAAHNVVEASDALLKLSAELSSSTAKFQL